MTRPHSLLIGLGVMLSVSACGSSTSEAPPSTAASTGSEPAPTSSTAAATESSGSDAGNVLAIVRQEPDGDNTDIYLIDEAGNETRLTTDEAFDEYPSVSPDGTRIAFDSFRSGDWETWIVNTDGTGLRQLTAAPGEDGYTSWSPDGDSVVLDSQRDGDYEIYVLDLNDESLMQLTDNEAWDGEPAWSPDGRRIVFHSDRDGDQTFGLWLMDVDGSNVERLTDNGFSPAWSPDASEIVFTKERTEGGDRDIWVMDVATREERLLAGGETWDDQPAWSADGSSIYFTSDRDGVFQVYSMDPNGDNIELIAGGAGDVFAPAVFAAP